MKSYDFEYDGLKLSDFGYIICNFDSGGLNIISNGSQIEFNTINVLNGSKRELVSSNYSECLETTFQICKTPCNDNNFEISINEIRELAKWLNRKEFHKFKLLNEEYTNLFFESSFNINRIENNGSVVGLELNMITNRPFALKESVSIIIENTEPNGSKFIESISDEGGFIYPHTEIVINQDGDLNIYNSLEDRNTYIANCVSGEVITMDYPMIESSLNSHKIQNDFNWNFFRIASDFNNRINDLTISIPCTIKLSYFPIVKVGI